MRPGVAPCFPLCSGSVGRQCGEARTREFAMDFSSRRAIPEALVTSMTLAGALGAERVPLYFDTIEHGRLTGGRIVVESTEPAFRAAFGLDQPAVAGGWPVTTIIHNGPTNNRIDLVVLGDGYTASQLGSYASQVSTVINGFFAQEPLNAYAPYFNVHRVDVVSNESGVDEIDLGIYRDTALDMAYGCFNIERLLCINVSLATAAAQSAPDVQQILALANSTRYGGAGYPTYDLGTVAGNNSSSLEIALHEFGHSFADLADEYDYADGATYSGPDPVEKNVSIYTAAQQVSQQRKWWRWMDLPNVDTFQGAAYHQFGIYRPTHNSKMRSLSRPFEQVNVEQFVINIYTIVKPIDDATPTVPSPTLACTPFFVDPMNPVGHSLSVQWLLDGVPVPGATGLTFTPDTTTLAFGFHTLTVRVVDNTTRVRDEALRSQWMTQTRTWSIFVPARYGDVTRDGLINLDDLLCVLAGFANPADCPEADLAPCQGNGLIDLDDILKVLAAFAGQAGCPGLCP